MKKNLFIFSLLAILALYFCINPILAASTSDTANITANIRLSLSDTELSKIHFRNVKIKWLTNAPATSGVYYDTIPHDLYSDYLFSKLSNPEKRVLEHSMTIAPLDEGTTYHCRVVSTINGQQPVVSDDIEFTTEKRWWKKDWMELLLIWY